VLFFAILNNIEKEVIGCFLVVAKESFGLIVIRPNYTLVFFSLQEKELDKFFPAEEENSFTGASEDAPFNFNLWYNIEISICFQL